MLELSKQKERANRGKYAEGQVRKVLEKLNNNIIAFDFERNYDARSSMGRIPARAGDFTFFGVRHGVIEVKEVDHDFRLPKKNFNPDKFPKIRKRQLANGLVVVLVYHRTTELWRHVPFEFFYDRRDLPSWVLSDFPTFKTDDLMSILAKAGVG